MAWKVLCQVLSVENKSLSAELLTLNVGIQMLIMLNPKIRPEFLKLVFDDRKVRWQKKIQKGSVFNMLHENLGMKKLRSLTIKQKHQCAWWATELWIAFTPTDLASSDYYLFENLKISGWNVRFSAETEAYFDKSFPKNYIEMLQSVHSQRSTSFGYCVVRIWIWSNRYFLAYIRYFILRLHSIRLLGLHEFERSTL